MPNRMVAVFAFDEPDDTVQMGLTIGYLKEQFQNMEGVKAYLGKNRAAQYILEFFETGAEVKSPLVEHAKRELALLNPDEEDDGFKESIVKAIQGFVSYGHSGGSASVAIEMINDLLQYKNLSPLTDDSREWAEVGPSVWQNRRNSEAFSEDGGKTHYLLSDEPRVLYETDQASKEGEDADG